MLPKSVEMGVFFRIKIISNSSLFNLKKFSLAKKNYWNYLLLPNFKMYTRQLRELNSKNRL
jgi:hypothetical protein